MRTWLLPFSWLYGVGVSVRNYMFDHAWKKSVEFSIPVISVGNLSSGGNGKTPHVEYLIGLLHERFSIGTLSRGYGRKTSGYRLVEATDSADVSGDESVQLKRKFTDIAVAVCEERAIGIPIMLLDEPGLQVIILDDAFQHRQVKPGLNLLLTDYSKPFTRDRLLPSGSLREPIRNVSRADAIIITKVPRSLSSGSVEALKKEVQRREGQPVFTSSLTYGDLYQLFEPSKKLYRPAEFAALLVTGIASANALAQYLREQVATLSELEFADHHRYNRSDILKIISAWRSLQNEKRIVITTEKDAVKLSAFKDQVTSAGVEIYCIPVEVTFAGNEKTAFDSFVSNFINNFIQRATDE